MITVIEACPVGHERGYLKDGPWGFKETLKDQNSISL